MQGLTTSEIVVDLNRVCSPGQAYVALSKVTSVLGLSISVSSDNVLMSKKLHLFRDNDCTRDHTVDRTIVLHNVKSLRKHFDEMVHDFRILNADMIQCCYRES